MELAQRKFLRQIAGYTSGDTGAFPRIILIDFWTDEEKKQQEEARQHRIKMETQQTNQEETCKEEMDPSDGNDKRNKNDEKEKGGNAKSNENE